MLGSLSLESEALPLNHGTIGKQFGLMFKKSLVDMEDPTWLTQNKCFSILFMQIV